ncbi:MAG: glutamate-5-semialdehyde dehydrogenase [Clostridia bacterium]
MDQLTAQATLARRAAISLGTVSAEDKNRALERMAQKLGEARAEILSANRRDLASAREKGMSAAFIERLTLNDARIDQMAQGLIEVSRLPDPVGTILAHWTRPNGLAIRKVRVPLGVIAIIYESRPNVTVDAAALCLKSGNAVILRGGSDAIHSNIALADVLVQAAREAGLPDGCVSLVEDTARETASRLMTLNGLIDVLIPRGGKKLIHSVVEQATVPVIQTGDGVCHIYVDGACDMEMAVNVAVSAKVTRPSVCNAAETLLVDRAIAERFLPRCLEALRAQGVSVRGCAQVRALCPWVDPATEADWDTEYNDLIYSVKVVDGVEEAIEHINRHGTRHSECIVTRDEPRARAFQRLVDAAAVYWNASTRFTDGGEFGFGAEIGISNQKLHARGPMGLEELTTYKYEIDGSGQVR